MNFLVFVRTTVIQYKAGNLTETVPCMENAVPLISPKMVGRRELEDESAGAAATVPKERIARAMMQVRNCMVGDLKVVSRFAVDYCC